MERIKFEKVKKSLGVNTYLDFGKKNIENYKRYPILKVNGIVTPLNFEIEEGANIEYEDVSTKWGNRTYVKTLSVIFAKAFNNLFPEQKADLNHFIGAGLYIDFENDFSLTLEDIDRIYEEMNVIISKDLDIETNLISKKEAELIFEPMNSDVMKLLETLEDINIGIVRIEEFIDINYSILAPKTSYIEDFKIMQYYPGILLITPNKENNFDVENYKEMPKLAKVFQKSTDQYKMLDLNKLSSINKKIIENKTEKMIKISEAVFDKSLINIAEKINEDKDIKIILISGPTSSGKTTFTSRLKVHLEVLGYSPIMISMDDYFLNRIDTPLDENGEYDFESPYAVNLELFNEDMYRLLNQETIRRRRFDFYTGVGSYNDEYIKPTSESIVMIEGIHALNPVISHIIPEKNKFKIYLSALNQVNLDAHNRVSTTFSRFIRRSVRDEKFRGYSIEETFGFWDKIRKSEELYVFPYQEKADMLLNTALPYETGIFKKHIKPMLESIREDSIYYNEARNMLRILEHFISIEDDSLINSESILREFIGK